jgi:DNA-binding PadR family transcriptional regulator
MSRSPLPPRDEHDPAPGSLTSAALHILLALADRERHGLGIAEDIESFTNGRLALGPGTLYGALKRLLEEGLVEDTATRPKGDTDDSRRRYYRITPRGRRTLEAETRDLANVLSVARLKRVLR